MKKLLAVLIILATAVMLFSCGGPTNTFVELKDNQALFVSSSSTPLVNLEDTETENYNLSYVKSVVYTLQRSYYSSSNGILYDGYYYYWSTSETADTEVLGTKTTKSSVKYSYIPLIESESIVVKTTTTRNTTFSFAGGEITKDVAITYELGGYFTDIEALKTASEDIYNMINHSTTRKYYVDTTLPEYKYSSTSTYNSFYYFENR